MDLLAFFAVFVVSLAVAVAGAGGVLGLILYGMTHRLSAAQGRRRRVELVSPAAVPAHADC